MKTLIIYDSKYGFTKECVDYVSELSSDYQSISYKEVSEEVLKEYQQIIIGGPIYMGRLRKKFQKYIKDNIDQLLDKKVGLFIVSSMPTSTEEGKKQLRDAFPYELYEHSIIQENLGGKVIKQKLGFFDKFVMNLVEKADKSSKVDRNSGLNKESIEKLKNMF